MYFDGASTQSSAGTGVVLISPSKENIHLFYKLDFKTTNNIAEYEALLLGVKDAKEMGIMLLQREIPMAWGITTDSLTP